jgi:two-component system, OmpR family, sensor kinase
MLITNWWNSIRMRMVVVMALSTIIAIFFAQFLIARHYGYPLHYSWWYVPVLPVVCLINWFLAGVVLRPMQHLLVDKEKLVGGDAGNRLPIPLGEPIETRELRESVNRLLDRLNKSFSVQTQFVADASHELRTPLTSIQGYTKLLLRRWPNVDSQLLLEALQTISTESGRLIRLVSDLLQLARSDSGQQVVNQLEVLDLCALLCEVEDTVMVIAPEGLEIKFTVPTEPIWVYGDNDALKQVFLNLVNNAIKATPPGGHITVGLTAEDECAVVRVVDTGIGIAAGDQARVFDRFFRIERSRTRSRRYGGGSGLGLTIALAIVNAHKGSIELQSEIDHGSTFAVKLPVADKERIEVEEQQMLDYYEDIAAGKSAI